MSAAAASPRQGRPDALTIVFAGMLVYVVSALVHEGAHAAAAVLSPHAPVSFFSSSNVIVDFRETPVAWIRLDLVAGTAAEMVVGVLAGLMVLRARGSALTRYTMVLLTVVSLSQAFGYPAAAAVFGFGDWGALIQGDTEFAGLPHPLAWQAAFFVVGAAGVVVLTRWMPSMLEPFLGPDQSSRIARATVLTALPYVVASLALTVMSLRNPQNTVASTATAFFVGTAPLLFARFSIDAAAPGAGATMLTPSRSWWMIGGGTLAAVLNLVIFAPGVRL